MACWYKFRKAKSWFNYFWVGLFRDGIGLLVNETLYLKTECMNLGNCLNANNDAIVSGQTDILLFDFKCRGSTAVVLLFFFFFVFFFVFVFCFFSSNEHRNIGINEMVIWTWFIKKHLRNILGSYGRNTKKLSAYLEKRVFLK